MSESTALAHARVLLARGLQPIPIPAGQKAPRIQGWQNLRLTEADLPRFFGEDAANIGVLLGAPSGWIIDVDLDHPRAVELADSILPATGMIWGRESKPRSHFLYRISQPQKSKRWTSKIAGMLLELRATGCQTIAPGSTHPSGEPVRFDDDGEPASIDPAELVRACEALAAAVKAELGELRVRRATASQASGTSGVATSAYVRGALRHEMDNVASAPEGTRNETLNRSAFNLGTLVGAGQLTRSEAEARLVTASAACGLPRDEAERTVASGLEAGARHPRQVADGRVVVDPHHTPPIARAFLTARFTVNGSPTLHHYAGEFFRHDGTAYRIAENAAIRRDLYEFLESECANKNGDDLMVNNNVVNAVMDAVAAQSHLPTSVTAPAWLGDTGDLPPAREIIACRSRLLHLPTMSFVDPTPRFFATSSLTFDPVPEAPVPARWHAFLDQLFADDNEQRQALQEFIGYLLTADTSQQKIGLIIGPKRSGKGTIARVLSALVGAENVAAPTTSSLAGNFGLQALLGKAVAIMSDARFRGDGVHAAIERLLAISGEDAIAVDRKYRDHVTIKLPTRFVILSNELPRLADASAAIASRFFILTLRRTFYGEERINLTRELLEELPGIFLWAVEGWRRLQERGRFVQPQSGADAQAEIEDLASPVGAFVRDACVVRPGCRVECVQLYNAWRGWCMNEGRDAVGTQQTFGRDLLAAAPSVCRRRGTEKSFYEGIALRSRAARVPGLDDGQDEPAAPSRTVATVRIAER